MYKNFLCTGISGRVSNVILRRTLHVIFGCLSNVIFGCLSNVIFNHLSNVILGFIPRIHAKSTPMDHQVEAEDDYRKRMCFKPEDDYKVMQCGRSMIEMLGVLAIIGALSVGGIVGYTKAMETIKSNQQREAIAELLYKMVEIKSLLDRNMETQHLVEVMYALNEMPKNYTYKKGLRGFYDIDNNIVDPQYGIDPTNGNTLRYALYVFFAQKPKEMNKYIRNYCYNLALVASSITDEVKSIYVYYAGNEEKPNGYGKTIFTAKSLKNISVAEIYQICGKSFPDDVSGVSHFTILLNPI